jgi:hypothetical protein
MKSLQILRDPSDALAKNTWPDWAMPNPDGTPTQPIVGISIVSNGYQDDKGSGWQVYGVMGSGQFKGQTTRCGDGWMEGGAVSQSVVSQVADTVMLTVRHDSNNLYGNGDFLPGVNWWDNTGAGLIPEGNLSLRNPADFPNGYQAPNSRTGAPYLVNKNARYGAVASVYADSGQFSFVDGHAKSMNPLKTNPDSVGQPEKNMWNARRQ